MWMSQQQRTMIAALEAALYHRLVEEYGIARVGNARARWRILDRHGRTARSGYVTAAGAVRTAARRAIRDGHRYSVEMQ